jgi:hypothetical protein
MNGARSRLPSRRRSETCEFTHEGLRFTASIGLYEDGRLGELFLSSNKPGSPIESIARDAAILVSLAIQFGCPLDIIRHALTKDHTGAPATLVGAALSALNLIPFPAE